MRKRVSAIPSFARIAVCLLAAGLVIGLAGCGSKADDDSSDTATVETKASKITKAIDKGKADKYFDVKTDGGSDGDDLGSGSGSGLFGLFGGGGDEGTDGWDEGDPGWDVDGDDYDWDDDDDIDRGNAGGLDGSHDDLGYYEMYSFGDSSGDYSKDDLVDAGIVFDLMMNGDGTGYITMMGDKFSLTWEDGTMYVDTDEGLETLTYYRSGDYLTLTDSDGYFVFEYAGAPDIR